MAVNQGQHRHNQKNVTDPDKHDGTLEFLPPEVKLSKLSGVGYFADITECGCLSRSGYQR
jgi:hypothetical protein